MSGLSLVTALIILVGVIGPLTYPQALALGAATPAGAAVVVGAAVVPTFYAVAMGASVALFLKVLSRDRDGNPFGQAFPPASLLLLAFLVWSVVVTLLAPLIFDGLPIVASSATVLTAGVVTTSNVAQVIYLALGVGVVVFLSRSPQTRPEVLGLALAVCLGLSFLRYLAVTFGLPFPDRFFDNSPNFNYIETSPGGALRVRGIMPEPAALATTCVTAMAYFAARCAAVVGWRRVGCLAVIAVAAFLGIVSTSATFVVAGLSTGVVLLVVTTVSFLSRRLTVGRTAVVVIGASLVLLLLVSPVVVTFVQSTIDSKIASSSYSSRSSSDTTSLGVFLDSYGFGVGLGSARGSSFLPTLLSATGLVGTLLFVLSVGVLFVRSRHVEGARPVLYALTAFLIVKLTSGPDISDPGGTLILGLGILGRLAVSNLPVGRLGTGAPGAPATAGQITTAGGYRNPHTLRSAKTVPGAE